MSVGACYAAWLAQRASPAQLLPRQRLCARPLPRPRPKACPACVASLIPRGPEGPCHPAPLPGAVSGRRRRPRSHPPPHAAAAMPSASAAPADAPPPQLAPAAELPAEPEACAAGGDRYVMARAPSRQSAARAQGSAPATVSHAHAPRAVRAQTAYWKQHSAEPTLETMMLDTKAREIDAAERPEIMGAPSLATEGNSHAAQPATPARAPGADAAPRAMPATTCGCRRGAAGRNGCARVRRGLIGPLAALRLRALHGPSALAARVAAPRALSLHRTDSRARCCAAK